MKSHAIRRVVVLLPGAATSNWRKLEGVMAFAHSRADWEVSVITSDRAADVRKSIRAVRPDGIICALLDDKSTAFIGRNVRQPIEVPDVVRAAGVSRRQLEKLFARELSTTVAESIRSMRLDHLAEQLRKSAAPASEVCRDCGWPHPAHAMRLFKKRFGKTMAEWR